MSSSSTPRPMAKKSKTTKPQPLSKLQFTARGFEYLWFDDHNGELCALQASSLAIFETPGTSAVWLGTDCNLMHLNRDQVRSLIEHLQTWLDQGTFEFSERRSRSGSKK